MKYRYKVLELSQPDHFESALNAAAKDGGRVISSSCGFVNSERYDFCNNYQAIIEFIEESQS